jgi:hypothetical protein
MTTPFISTEDLGTYMGQDLTASDLAVVAVDAACESVRTYLDRRLNLTTDTVRVDGSGTDALMLQGPIVNVDTITENDSAVSEDDYVLGDSMIFKLGGVWSPGRLNIVVAYTYGYAVTEAEVGADSGDVGVIERMPSDIREVALELAQSILNSGGSSASGAITGEDIGDYSYTVDAATILTAGGGLNSTQTRRLSPYRYIPVA